MDIIAIMGAYYDKFGYNPGIPWNGFPDEETEKEYWETLQKCIDTGIPLTKKQLDRFHPPFDLSGGKVY